MHCTSVEGLSPAPNDTKWKKDNWAEVEPSTLSTKWTNKQCLFKIYGENGIPMIACSN